MSMALQVPTWTMGELLRKAREDAHLDQADIADALSVSRPLVSRWERNLSVPTFPQVIEMARLTRAEWLVPSLTELTSFRWNPDWAAQDVREGYGDGLHPSDLLAPDYEEREEPATVLPFSQFSHVSDVAVSDASDQRVT